MRRWQRWASRRTLRTCKWPRRRAPLVSGGHGWRLTWKAIFHEWGSFVRRSPFVCNDLPSNNVNVVHKDFGRRHVSERERKVAFCRLYLGEKTGKSRPLPVSSSLVFAETKAFTHTGNPILINDLCVCVFCNCPPLACGGRHNQRTPLFADPVSSHRASTGGGHRVAVCLSYHCIDQEKKRAGNG